MPTKTLYCCLLLFLAYSFTTLHAQEKAQNPNIAVKRESNGCFLAIGKGQIEYWGGKDADGITTIGFRCDLEQKDQILATYKKALEWEDQALAVNAENFSRTIPNLQFKEAPVVFMWFPNYTLNTYNFGQASYHTGIYAKGISLSLKDVRIFMDLAKQLPAMEKELAERIEKAKAQSELFK